MNQRNFLTTTLDISGSPTQEKCHDLWVAACAVVGICVLNDTFGMC